MKPQPFPVIRLSGSPRDRGKEYGIQAADRVHRSEQIYVAAMEKRGFRWSEIKCLAADFTSAIAAFNPVYLDEMEGIAEGACVDLESIVVVNARSEIFNGRSPGERQLAEEGMPEEGCTSAVALGVATKDGNLIHGQNWDFMSECVHSCVVLHIEQDQGPPILTFVEAGGLARCGLNGAGIALTGNSLKSDQDYRRSGVPLSLIRRGILEADTFASAVGAVTSAERATSSNMTISISSGDEAINLETVPDEIFPLWPTSNGVFAHANHFQSPVALGKLLDFDVNSTGVCSTYLRQRRVLQQLSSKAGQLTVADFKEVLADTFDAPYGVCRAPVEGASETESGTVATIIFDSQAGEMHVRPAPYDPDTAYTVYRLQEVANIQDSNL